MVGRKQVLVLLLFLLFILERTIVPWLIPEALQLRITHNFVLIAILFVSVYYHRHTALVLGIVFGMLHDIVFYGEMMGTYSFAMGFTAYVIGFIFKGSRSPMPVMMTAIVLGSLLFDSTLFGIYKLFQLNHTSYNWAILHYMLPDVIIHFVFGLIIYVPLRKQLEQLTRYNKKEKAS